MGQPQDLFHRPRRQAGLAAASFGDHPYPGDTPLGEPGPPSPHRIRIDLATPSDLIVGHPTGGPQQRTGLHDLPMRQRRHTAIRPNSIRCSSVINKAIAVIHKYYQISRPIRRRTTSGAESVWAVATAAVDEANRILSEIPGLAAS